MVLGELQTQWSFIILIFRQFGAFFSWCCSCPWGNTGWVTERFGCIPCLYTLGSTGKARRVWRVPVNILFPSRCLLVPVNGGVIVADMLIMRRAPRNLPIIRLKTECPRSGSGLINPRAHLMFIPGIDDESNHVERPLGGVNLFGVKLMRILPFYYLGVL